VPYWRGAAEAARRGGVKVAIEMHPNFVVYNPETMLRLREIAPDVIGCNFDPSHLFWQGADPVAAIRALGDAIFHVHAKDCRLDRHNIAVNGVLDAKKYTREAERSWIFRTVGYGNDALVWKDIISTLRTVGYDHVISIEHEDSLMSPAEGLRKAIAVLKGVVIGEAAREAYWAGGGGTAELRAGAGASPPYHRPPGRGRGRSGRKAGGDARGGIGIRRERPRPQFTRRSPAPARVEGPGWGGRPRPRPPFFRLPSSRRFRPPQRRVRDAELLQVRVEARLVVVVLLELRPVGLHDLPVQPDRGRVVRRDERRVLHVLG